MRTTLHIPQHKDDVEQDFPTGTKQVLLDTPPCVGDVVQLDLCDASLIYQISLVQHRLSIQHDMEAETHVYMTEISKKHSNYHHIYSVIRV